MKPKIFTQHAGGIEWYCEQRGSGPFVVLIPSGEGDCASFEAVAAALADQFTVLTFDTPGFSRTSAPQNVADISPHLLAKQISGLIASLGIQKATFYGCSSAGLAVLDLVLDHAPIVRNIVVHEAPIPDPRRPSIATLMGDLLSLDDAGIVKACKHLYANLFNENQAAWEALGAEYHTRLERNYVTWVRRYWTSGRSRTYDPAELMNRPIAWTIGGLSPAAAFFTNTQLAFRAQIELDLLMCKHFPQVSIPEILAAHIRQSTLPYIA